MAQTGNDILKQILGVCVQINKKLDKKGDTGEGGGGLAGIFGRGRQKTAEKGTKIIDALFKSISGFVKMKPSDKKMERTSKGLRSLFETVIWIGDNQRKAQNAINLLDSLGEKLKNAEKTMNAMSKLMLAIGGSIVLLVGGVILAGKLLGTRSFVATMSAVVLIIGVMVGSLVLLGMAEKWVDKGSKVAKEMGIGMMFLSGGVVLFALGIAAVGNIIGAAGPQAMIVGILGILGIIGVMGLTFSILGQFSTNIILGSVTAGFMAIGLAAIGWGVKKLAESAAALTGMGDGGEATKKSGEKRGKFGQMMSEIGPGLGMIGIVIVSSALLFATLSLISVPVIIGSIITLLISFALTRIAKSVVAMADTAKALEGTDVKSMVKNMVGGVIGGLVDGYSEALGGGKGIKGMLKTGKNVAMLFTALTTLRGISKGLSLFAKAISAFAELDNMKVIKGYKEDGDPIFGETVNIKGVAEKITDSISTFLTALVGIEGLTKKKSKAIDRVAKALTGRRGMLRAVIDFSKVMETYSKFGDGSSIPWSYTVETGEKDENGNPITKTVSGTVSLTQIVDNIVNTFTRFVNDFTTKMQDFELSGRQGRKMKRLSEVLSGRRGLLTPITEFADVLQKYSQFGANNMIPIYDKDGNITDKSVSLTKVASNIFTAISKFVTISDEKLGDITKRDIREASGKVKAFGGFVKQLNKLTSLSPDIDKTSQSLLSMASSVGKLAAELEKLDTDTLAAINKIGKNRLPGLIAMTGVGVADAAANLVPKIQEVVEKRQEAREERQERREERREEKKEAKQEKRGKSDAQLAQEKMEEQQRLADMIGAAINAAFESKQFTFDFQGENKGILNVE